MRLKVKAGASADGLGPFMALLMAKGSWRVHVVTDIDEDVWPRGFTLHSSPTYLGSHVLSWLFARVLIMLPAADSCCITGSSKKYPW